MTAKAINYLRKLYYPFNIVEHRIKEKMREEMQKN